ncbi:bis(5'-nucleosyl)-tetraphosphatase PrpE [Sutcliffiella rhizosphaerae]|uniref:Bis(5'-nucleosyl)-tetraphosphatase PrpE [asymmetrical] n=1 Tax=Sutcliffiella rhizosphaerae TaxID=2880967 RepID=A0ABN8AGF4_9BACI|nr:bis(5'-nucleosyl)-tetraphosphatase PrpE [Sutcliffiella rhizosphaerae]CAG9622827.1 Bis(5'-nucleosyl)-tetraphosphatase PrpE [asymmetrical] [Sutcliffiella rhizosphaerae]
MKIDIIGDIHGCKVEFIELLKALGYISDAGVYRHPNGRKLGLVGDLTDRGPDSIGVVRMVSQLVENGNAYYVPGNHCNKLYRFLLGNKVQQTHGLETTVAELDALSTKDQQCFRTKFISLYENAPLYQVLDNKRLIIAHAGLKKEFIGQQGNKVKTFVLYGDITGEFHPNGMPIRRDWAQSYDGDAWIVYGHTPVREVRVVNKTANIDTGAVFGGKLSALRYPEMETVSVESSMPFVKEKFRELWD